MLGNVKRSLDGTYHHCEVRYLAEFQYRLNRRYNLAAMLQRLLQAAVTALPQPILFSSVALPELASLDGAAPPLRARRRIGEAPCPQ